MLSVEQAIEAIQTPGQPRTTRKVRLQHDILTDEQFKALIETVINNPAVKCIDILHCRIQETGLRTFAAQLPYCNLSVLKLNQVDINDELCASFAGAIQECHIQHLEMSNNLITAEGARSIANMLQDCGIKSLNIGLNNIGREGGMHLAEALLATSHCLETLDLRICNIGTEAAMKIAQAIEGSTLQELQLDHNDLNLFSVHAFCLALPRCQLQSLSLGGNNLNNKALVALSEMIMGNPNLALRRLFLHSNQFTDMGVKRLFKAIGQFPYMQAVDIQDNRKVKQSGEYIFNCIKTHCSLKQVLLTGTSIPLEIQTKFEVLTSYKSKLLIYVCFSKLRGTTLLSILPVELLIWIGQSIPN